MRWTICKTGVKPHDPFGLVSTHDSFDEAQARRQELEKEYLTRSDGWWPMHDFGISIFYLWPEGYKWHAK
jgi:hypothetical protein